MACENWKDLLIARLYDEADPADAAKLATHLEQCSACRDELEQLGAARGLLRRAEPALPVSPRVVLLAPPPLRRPVWAFATGFACAVLILAAGLGAGFALRGRQQPVAAGTSRAEVESLLEAQAARFDRKIEEARPAVHATPAAGAEGAVTRKDLDAAFARLEKRMADRRAADLGYVLDAISASELRSSARIGQTTEALRYVALANDPRISAQ